MSVVEVKHGGSPVILGFPHTGTDVPVLILDQLDDNGRVLADTDWHLHTLYEGLLPDATTVRATFHRYVIDANRDPAGVSLYPGQNTTGLVPVTDFDGKPIWREGCKPTEKEIAERRAAFHAPYHAVLSAETERVRELHGIAVVYDCHSIRSRIPFLFDGILPDFNVGTDSGRTCSPRIESAVWDAAGSAADHTRVLNGRFKGGWTTRHYGRPARGIHAIQMELAQSTYLATELAPFAYDHAKAANIRPYLQNLLEQLAQTALSLKEEGTPP